MPKQFFTRTIMQPELPNLCWNQLETTSQLTFSVLQRQTLLAALNRYLGQAIFEHQIPQTKDVQRKLQRIHCVSTELASLLRTPPSRQTSAGYAPPEERQLALHEAVMGEAFPFNVISPHEFIRALSSLTLNTKVAMTRLREKSHPGRQDKEALDVMIRTWHVIYIQAGGSGLGCTRSGGSSKAKGPFLDLLEDTFQQVRTSLSNSFPIEGIPPTRDALAQRIRAALRQPHVGTPRDEK